MITIKYKDKSSGEERTIEASGLGSLGWELDSMGCDTSHFDDDFEVVSVELVADIKPFLYRDHRGSLASSMETVQEMHSAEQLRKHVRGVFGEGKVTVEDYGGIDDRIGWDTHLVCWEDKAVGMTNAMVDMEGI